MSLSSALCALAGRAARRPARPEGFVAPLLLLAAVGLVVCALAIIRDQRWLLLVGALVLGPPYGALQNLTLLIAFARVPPAGIPTASAVWNLGFDAGTATGSVVVGALRGRLVVRVGVRCGAGRAAGRPAARPASPAGPDQPGLVGQHHGLHPGRRARAWRGSG